MHYPESSDPADKAIMARFKGKRVPLIGQVDISIIEEANPRLQAFERGQLDYIEIPVDLVSNVLEPDNTIKPRFKHAGVVHQRAILPGITYTWFNMEDPVVGGYTKEKIALRRAIGMAYNVDEEARVVRQGQAVWASQIVPPGVTGHDPKFVGNTKYDPEGAKALLDKFGYVDRDKDGWRDLPDGKPLVLKKGTSPSALERQYDELWKRNMTAIGIRIDFVTPEVAGSSEDGAAAASCRCGSSATARPAPKATASSACCTAATRGSPTCRASSRPTTTACTKTARSFPTVPSARSSCARCRRSSPPTRRGSSTRIATRTFSSTRGSRASRSTRSTSIRGCTWISIPRQRARPSNDLSRPASHPLRASRSTSTPRPIPTRCCACCSVRRRPASTRRPTSDLYSNYVNRAIFEPPFRYDFRARPHKVVPNTTVALPEGNKDGTEWTITVRPGIYFTDDPAFKGKKRELTAADYAFQLEAHARSEDALAARSIFSTDASSAWTKCSRRPRTPASSTTTRRCEGLQVVDKYTLKLKLNYPWWDIAVDLTNSSVAAVAREVVEAYGDASGWVMQNPVGTGPYKLKEWRRAQRIALEANPDFRGIPFVESTDPADKAINARFKGKTFPRIGRVEIAIMEEGQTRVLAFTRGELDYLDIPYELVPNVMEPDNTLKPPFAKAGVLLERDVQPSITFAFFNMEDPVVGGYTPEKIALRRAIGMAYNVEDEIRIIRQGQGKVANMLLPPSVSGYDPNFFASAKYDPAAARALLDKFGYVDRDKDGWRDMPDGKPLVIKRGTSPSALERQYDELWQRNMNAIGVKIEMVTQKWPDLLKMARNGQLQFWQLANTSTTTDGYGFLGLLYGPNAGLANLSRFKHRRVRPAVRRVEEAPRRARAREARAADVARSSRRTRRASSTAYRIENVVVYPWVIGYKYNPFNQHPWQYLDIDPSVPRKAVQ